MPLLPEPAIATCRPCAVATQPKLNKHSVYIDKRITDIQKKKADWQTLIGSGSSHKSVIRDFSHCIFTNLVHSTFTRSYMKKHPCSDCGNPSTDRCHGIGEERPILLQRALERVWRDTSKSILLQEIIIAFLEEHKYTEFTFKCNECHKKEKR